MKRRTVLGGALLVALVLALAAGTGPVRVEATSLAQEAESVWGVAAATVTPRSITWQPLVDNDGAALTVAGPGGFAWERTFAAGEEIVFAPGDAAAPDGTYSYDLTLRPRLSAEVQAALAAAAEGAEREKVVAQLRGSGQLPADLRASGHWRVEAGAIVAGGGEEPGAPGGVDGGGQIEDYVVSDDLIVTGSQCLGYDCATDGTESFGFDTIKLKENNLQIYFDDTSTTQGFPDNDWRIIANDSASGGAEYIKIQDSSNSKEPFKIMAGAPTNSIYVSDAGRLGLGTSTPAQDVHIVSGDTPAVRLDQDTTSGWTAQTWDVAGNETSFFVRDVTAGSKLPFRIQPGTPTNTLTMKATGDVGLGTWSPEYDLQVERTGENPQVVAHRTDGAYAFLSATDTAAQVGSLTDAPLELVVNGVTRAVLDAGGNLQIEGALTEASDVNRKQDFCAVDQGSVLSRLASLPVFTWSYKGESARHMGPVAQDFYAAFGLGVDDKHIAPLDANGVALAGIQELYRQLQAEQAETARLSAENEDLRQRLDTLEALVAQLLAAQAEK